MIPYGRQDITAEDIQAVKDVLESDYLTQGPAVPKFEAALSAYTGAPYALAVNSATSALHIACLALDLGPGDVLWTSPITFVASANCALYCGARVDFVDIDPHTYNMSVEALEKKLKSVSDTGGQLPKIVVPVHLCGQSCDMEAIYNLSQQYGFKIIEDASHAIGAKYKNQPVGNCAYSDITVFSFHPVKIITTAEGGAALTRNPALAKRMGLLRSHGITRDPADMTHSPDGPWYYQQIDLGYNYRMTDLQAALGVSQMNRLDEYVSHRQFLAKRYDRLLKAMPLLLPAQHPDTYSAYHLYPVLLRLESIGCTHKQAFEALRSAGIGVNLHYIPVHKQPYYQQLGFKSGDYPVAEAYYEAAITLPLYGAMTEEQQDKVIAVLSDVLDTPQMKTASA